MNPIDTPPFTAGANRDPAVAAHSPGSPDIGLAAPAQNTNTARVVFIIPVLLAFAYLACAVVLSVFLAWLESMILKAPVR